MPLCYVTMPFGRKTSRATGQLIDYDRVYAEILRPAAEQAGCSVVRLDEYAAGGIVHKSMLRLGIACDVFIADLGDGNPNVMYEVGVRHAARPASAILVSPSGHAVPWALVYSRVLMYAVGNDGALDPGEVTRMRDLLGNAIRQALSEHRNDSPVFEFFPGYSVELPPDLTAGESRRGYSPAMKQALARPVSPKGKRRSAQEVEEIFKATSGPDDAAAAIEVLKKYREAAAWDDLIRFADELPDRVRGVAQIEQMVALALNRRNEPGDRDRAIAMLDSLIEKTGGDAETRAILGRIYKDRFDATGDPDDIRRAIEHYRLGFEKEPSDYYTGARLVDLLLEFGGEAGRRELQSVLPRVRSALNDRLDPDRADYWELATAMDLAGVAGDWDEARGYAERLAAQASARWMIDSVLSGLRRRREALDPSAAAGLDSVENILSESIHAAEGRNA